MVPMVCTGPISYTGKEAVARDIANQKSNYTRFVVAARQPGRRPRRPGAAVPHSKHQSWPGAMAPWQVDKARRGLTTLEEVLRVSSED